MNYRSTRDTNLSLSAAETIARGLSREGGLFVPENLPKLTKDELLAELKALYEKYSI